MGKLDFLQIPIEHLNFGESNKFVRAPIGDQFNQHLVVQRIQLKGMVLVVLFLKRPEVIV